jgi:hypothetical protein
MKDYMNLTLQLNAFPTHIINKDGSIAKVMSDYKSLGSFYESLRQRII